MASESSNAEFTVGLISIGTPWFDVPTATRHLATTREVLRRTFNVTGPEQVIVWETDLNPAIAQLKAARVDALVLQIGTFPIGDAPAALAQALGVPIVVHSLPEPDLSHQVGLNSLCGANLATYTLTALEHPHTFVHGAPDEPAVVQQLTAHLRAIRALHRLRQSRLSLIGFRAPGFYPCSFDELLLRRQLGVAIDHIGLQALSAELECGARKPAPVTDYPAIEGGELSPAAGEQMERYYGALTNVLTEHNVKLAAIKDWPEFYDDQAAGGFWPVLGWVQDDDVVLAVEGDVNGAVTMAIEHELTGGVPFLADISAWDDAGSTLTLWHYGGAPSLARDRSEIRYGAEGHEVQFTLKPGRVTLVRLGLQHGQFRLLAIAGEISDEAVTLRRAAAKAQTLKTPAGDIVRQMLGDGWEHHVCLIYGDIGEELAVIARLTGIPLRSL